MKYLIYYIMVLFYCDSYSQRTPMYNKIEKKSPPKNFMFAPKREDVLKKFVNPTELQVEINKEKYFINEFPFDSISTKEKLVYYSSHFRNGRVISFNEIKTFREIDKNVERFYVASEDSLYFGSYSEIITDPKTTVTINNEEFPIKYKSHYEYYTHRLKKDSFGSEYFEKCNQLKSYNKYIIIENRIIDYYQQIEFGEAFYYNQNGKLVNKIDFDKDYKKSFFDIKNKLSEYNNYEGFVQKTLVNNKPFWQLHFSSLEKENNELVDFTLYIDGKTGELFKHKPMIDDTQNLYEKIANQNNFKILKLSQTKNFLQLLKSTTQSLFLKEVIENINSSGRVIQFRNDQHHKDINLFGADIVLKTNNEIEYKSWYQFRHRFSDNAGVIDVPSKAVFLNFSNLLSSNVIQNKQLLNRLTQSNFIVQEIKYSLNDKIEIKFLGFFEKIVDEYESKNVRYSIVFSIEETEMKVSIESKDYFKNKIEKDIILIKK